MIIVITVPDLDHCPLQRYDQYFGETMCRVFGCRCRKQCQAETRLDALAIPDPLPQHNKTVLCPMPVGKSDADDRSVACGQTYISEPSAKNPDAGHPSHPKEPAPDKPLPTADGHACPVCGKYLPEEEPCCENCREAYKKIKQKEYHKRWYEKKRAAAAKAKQVSAPMEKSVSAPAQAAAAVTEEKGASYG